MCTEVHTQVVISGPDQDFQAFIVTSEDTDHHFTSEASLTSHIVVIQEAVGQCMRYLWNQKISEERNKYINIDSLIK